MTFEKDLTKLINNYSRESESDTPDYILAQFILECLSSFEIAINERDKWHGFTNKEEK